MFRNVFEYNVTNYIVISRMKKYRENDRNEKCCAFDSNIKKSSGNVRVGHFLLRPLFSLWKNQLQRSDSDIFRCFGKRCTILDARTICTKLMVLWLKIAETLSRCTWPSHELKQLNAVFLRLYLIGIYVETYFKKSLFPKSHAQRSIGGRDIQ